MDPQEPITLPTSPPLPPSPQIPKTAKTVSFLLFLWFSIQLISLIATIAALLILNYGYSWSGGLPFSVFSYMPIFLLIPVINALFCLILIYPAFKIRNGSSQSYRLVVFAVIVYVILGLFLSGFTYRKVMEISNQINQPSEINSLPTATP